MTPKLYLILMYVVLMVAGLVYGAWSWKRLSHPSEVKSAQASLGVSFAAPIVVLSSLALMMTVLWAA